MVSLKRMPAAKNRSKYFINANYQLGYKKSPKSFLRYLKSRTRPRHGEKQKKRLQAILERFSDIQKVEMSRLFVLLGERIYFLPQSCHARDFYTALSRSDCRG